MKIFCSRYRIKIALRLKWNITGPAINPILNFRIVKRRTHKERKGEWVGRPSTYRTICSVYKVMLDTESADVLVEWSWPQVSLCQPCLGSNFIRTPWSLPPCGRQWIYLPESWYTHLVQLIQFDCNGEIYTTSPAMPASPIATTTPSTNSGHHWQCMAREHPFKGNCGASTNTRSETLWKRTVGNAKRRTRGICLSSRALANLF